MQARSACFRILLRVFVFGVSVVASRSDIMFKGQVSTIRFRVVRVGGAASIGASAGALCLSSGDVSVGRGRSVGGRLAVSKIGNLTPFALSGKYGNPIALGSESEQRGRHQR